MNPLDIPDICYVICQQSEKADLCRLTRVSKDWYSCANPLLWERIPDISHLLALLPAASLPKRVSRGSKTLVRVLDSAPWGVADEI